MQWQNCLAWHYKNQELLALLKRRETEALTAQQLGRQHVACCLLHQHMKHTNIVYSKHLRASHTPHSSAHGNERERESMSITSAAFRETQRGLCKIILIIECLDLIVFFYFILFIFLIKFRTLVDLVPHQIFLFTLQVRFGAARLDTLIHTQILLDRSKTYSLLIRLNILLQFKPLQDKSHIINVKFAKNNSHTCHFFFVSRQHDIYIRHICTYGVPHIVPLKIFASPTKTLMYKKHTQIKNK